VTLPDLRVGSGFDVHAFSADPARTLVLGGVTIGEARGLHGHSDADVIAHACAEALLGSVGRGDLGTWFPDTDPAHAGADSIELLRTVADELRRDGWSAINIDCSVICEQPRLAPYRDAMQSRLSDAVGAPVTVKGRRAEGMGALGRREGIACFAVALVHRIGVRSG
jgi:2-C-methyl-D-erythritol 2,4-cyclodiphosphate synthase